MFKPLGIAALTFCCASLPALAQRSDLSGRWQCQHGNQTVTNNNFENWIYQFGLELAPNGQFRASGNYTAATAGFSVPFQAQGQWQQSRQGVLVQGSEQRADGTRQPFTLVFTNILPGQISYRNQSGYGNLATFCQM